MSQNQNQKWNWLAGLLDEQPGFVSCVYKNLKTEDSFFYNAEKVHPSASVIKIYLMAFVYHLFQREELRPEDRVPLRREGMAFSSGVLHYLRDAEEMSVRDLVELMIIVSDNSATNLLLELVGLQRLQAYMKEELGLSDTRFQRKMMDFEAAAAGLQNYTSAAETAAFLEKLWRGQIVSPEASAKMLQVMKEQQFNEGIPFWLEERLIPENTIAHKSGGLEGVAHDAAVVDYGKAPFVLCFFGSETDTASFQRLMGDAALRVYRELQGE